MSAYQTLPQGGGPDVISIFAHEFMTSYLEGVSVFYCYVMVTLCFLVVSFVWFILPLCVAYTGGLFRWLSPLWLQPYSQSSIQEEDASENADSLSREELGRAIGSRWTGKKTEQQQDEDAGTPRNNDDNEYDETSDNAHEEEDSGYDTETEEDHQHHEEDDNEDQMDDIGGDEADDEHKYESDDEMDMSGA